MFTSINEFKRYCEALDKDQVFTFFSRSYDIKKAYDLIEANPEKYKAENGEFYAFDLANIEKMFSTMTPEDKEKLEKGEKVSISMGVKITYDHAMGISDNDLEEPGVWIVEDDGDFSILIDGWHRAYARWKKGLKKMKIWVIQDPKDIKQIRLN